MHILPNLCRENHAFSAQLSSFIEVYFSSAHFIWLLFSFFFHFSASFQNFRGALIYFWETSTSSQGSNCAGAHGYHSGATYFYSKIVDISLLTGSLLISVKSFILTGQNIKIINGWWVVAKQQIILYRNIFRFNFQKIFTGSIWKFVEEVERCCWNG